MARVREVWRNHFGLIALLAFLFVALTARTGVVLGQTPDRQWETRALELLDGILERPEFQWEPERETLLQRFWTWLGRHIFNLLPDIAPGGRVASTLLAVAGAALLLAVLGYIAYRIRRQVKVDAEYDLETDESRWRDADHALSDAQAVAEQGDLAAEFEVFGGIEPIEAADGRAGEGVLADPGEHHPLQVFTAVFAKPRHVELEVSNDDTTYYTVETVFTRFE